MLWPISVDCYFGTDTLPAINPDYRPFKMIFSGKGEWSDRLLVLLNQIPEDFILYLQEDHYSSGVIPDLSMLMDMIRKDNLLRLQLSPVNKYYTLSGSKLPLFFHPSSKYLVSHQPSIWRKDFLISCLKPGENPWQNEYEGTKRLQNDPKIQNRIAIYPCDWYDHKCVKGNIVT
jgi:hypothetical protein